MNSAPMQAQPSAFAHPDRQWRTLQVLRWITVGLGIAVLIGLFAMLFSLVSGAISGDFLPSLGILGVVALLTFAILGTAIGMWATQTDGVRAFTDALTYAGYPGVDGRRLYARRPAPTPYGFWLVSRRERRPDGTWLIVEPVPGGPNGPAPAAPPPGAPRTI